ncbi:MAG TPA: diguanylate cyclase [Limnobacter sp.]|uniref:GGDEF domain-containing protein n=1 Tax=Limnobacter sp. TaxID=2003368 RepID=UPI002EDAB106
MSFKWKWLLTTFVAQLFMGALFASIQYMHLSKVALQDVDRFNFELRQELNRVQNGRNSYSRDALTSVVRNFHSKHRPAGVWIEYQGKRLFEFGDLFQTANPVPQAESALQEAFSLPTPGHVLWVRYDPDEVYRARNDMVVFVLGVFALSAVACGLMLLSLSRALSARLEDLRVKALELQSGLIHSRIEITGRDEISDLGVAFNRMAQAIEEQMLAMEASHAKSEAERNRLDLLLSSLGSGVAYLDEHFNVLYVNKALAHMLRLPFPYTETPRLETLLLKAGLEKDQAPLLNDLVTDYFGHHKVPIELDFEEGRVLQFRFVIYSDQVQGPQAVLIVEDVSIQKNVEDLRHEVERDPLTDVLNRRGFDLSLQSRVSRLLPGETFGLLFLDLDGFKAVNDTLGHKAGDQVLKTTALLLKGATRNVDQIARLGGDEFAVIVARCSPQLLVNIANRIIDSFATDKHLNRIRQNHGLSVSCSIGGALYPTHSDSIQGMLDMADSLMYQAKKAGKNCHRLAQAQGLSLPMPG